MKPNGPRHLVDVLRWRASHQSAKAAFTFLSDDDAAESTWTYEELDQRARSVAAALLENASFGDRALLLCPPGMDFAAAIFGCFYSGVVAVPAYPPGNARQVSRIAGILRNASAELIVTNSQTRDRIEKWLRAEGEGQSFRFLAVDDVPLAHADLWTLPALATDTLAFLQYTSGSTSEPKGVMVSHGNLMANLLMIKESFGLDGDSDFGSWLPMFHDMGLIGNVLEPLFLGSRALLMSPQAFVREPIRWLRMLAKYRSHTTGAPNFGYALCVQSISEEQKEGLDLSHLKIAYCGSEPIDWRVMDRFTEAFRANGFTRNVFYPCYGMAEATLLSTGSIQGAGPRYLAADEKRTLVGCGYSANLQDLRIVDPVTRQLLPDGGVGEVWLRGPHIAQGYWQNRAMTAEIFEAALADGDGPFLRTGDLGFINDANVFITGRIKDVIIIRGRNYYPQDIERTAAECSPSLQLSGGAAFAVDRDGREELVLVQEVRRSALRDIDAPAAAQTIRDAVAAEHEIAVGTVVLLKPASLPKTSSGKVRRSATKEAFLNGTLDVLFQWGTGVPACAADDEDPTGEGACLPLDAAGEVLSWLRDYASRRIDSRLIDERRTIPPYVVLDFGNRGLLGLQAPREAGGLALSHRDTYRVLEQLAAIDLTLGSFVGVHNALGMRPLLRFATAAQQERWLARVAQGRELAAFAFTEPAAGSNPGAIESTATPDGKGGWTLRGSKRWIGTAAWAGVVHVFAHLIGDDGRHRGLAAFIVSQDAPGFVQGAEELTMGMRGMVQNTIHLNDVPVTADDMLGGPADGMAIAQDIMEFGRTCIAASAVGVMKRCAQLMARYGKARTIATGRLLDNVVTRQRLGQLTVETAALEALVYTFAQWLDDGMDLPKECFAAIKVLSAEAAYRAVDHLVQLLGGRGYIETNIAPQLLRDVRLLRIFEGPSETMQMFVGNRVAANSAPFFALLRQTLGAESIAAALESLASEVKTRDGQHAAMLLGEAGTFALWLAVVEKTVEKTPSAAASRAWLRAKFDAALAAARSAQDETLAAADLERIINGYAGQIGDIDQHRPGVVDALDPLLRRKAAFASAVVPATTVPGRHPERSEGSQPTESPRSARDDGAGVGRDAGAGVGRNATRVAAAPMDKAAIERWLQNWIAQRMRRDVSTVGVTRPFADLGLDSLTAVELTHHLEQALGVSVPPTATWDYPNIQTLAASVAGAAPPAPTAPADPLDELSERELAALLAGELQRVP
jgi:acyl-CoA synthetase (AMP-forming)/AMP-acid ligase II/alkylation response protein AidB-like acyl-CoA dehydrogenase/acyl carrier protein